MPLSNTAFLKKVWPVVRARAKVLVVSASGKRQYHRCLYRKDRTATNTALENCCFVGALIAPQYYLSALEGLLVSAPFVQSRLARSLDTDSLTPVQLSLMEQLQYIHDAYMPHEWRKAISKVFADFKSAVKTNKKGAKK